MGIQRKRRTGHATQDKGDPNPRTEPLSYAAAVTSTEILHPDSVLL